MTLKGSSMKKFIYWFIALSMMIAVNHASALQTVTDYAVRSPNASNQQIVSSVAVPGGTLYTTATMNNGVVQGGTSSVFVPTAYASPLRYMNLTNAKSDVGVSVTATPGSGVVGISRTAGTSMYLAGETTSASAVTDKAVFETNLPDTYITGSNIPVVVHASVSGAGTLNAGSTTMTVVAYTEVNGVETALPVSAAQQIVAAGSTLTFTVTGTGLVPGQHIVIELVMLVTSSSGANTGHINSVAFQG
jgi:hypothetical protein